MSYGGPPRGGGGGRGGRGGGRGGSSQFAPAPVGTVRVSTNSFLIKRLPTRTFYHYDGALQELSRRSCSTA